MLKEILETSQEVNEEVVNISVKYEADEKFLKVIETPNKIIPIEKVYNIEEIKNRIEKNTNVRNQWQVIIDADQAILDKYDEIK